MDKTLKSAWAIALLFSLFATLAILTLKPWISDIQFAPDQGFNWYYWKRPDPDFWSRLSMWAGYITHQIFIWGLIAWAQRNKDKLRNRNTLHPLNVIALVGTAGFVALHYLQTAFFYDGLGQDLPVITSQSSVILLLVVVLLMEAPRRGLFFGKGRSWFTGARATLIKYHGYYFAWAITFTFWYHPMEITNGHLLGFFYTMLLFVQAAFLFTRVHTNRVWTFILEFTVVIHGVTVALVAGQEFWPMFAFGFLFLFIVTQMHGLGLSKPIRWGFAILYLIGVAVVYADRGWANLNEIIRIPVIDYALVALLAGLIWLAQKIAKGRTAPMSD